MRSTVRRIAHLSDVHILDGHSRSIATRYRLATKFVSLGRAIDPVARRQRLARALAAAKANGADHVVISGDLTEVGDEAEFESFAETLHDARLPLGSVTLVPGNHDAYTTPDAWKKALLGPLAHFASSSASEPGRVVDRGNVVLLPIDTSCFQSIALAGGEFSSTAALSVAQRLDDPGLRDKTVVLVLHHSPFDQYRAPPMRWVDGLRGCAQVLELLARHPRLQLLHGHLHKVVDRIVGRTVNGGAGGSGGGGAGSVEGRTGEGALTGARSERPRVFGAPATCDDSIDKTPRVRIYDVHEGGLEASFCAA